MPVQPLVAADNPVLRRRARPVEPAEIGGSEIQGLITDLWDTLSEQEGVGLAAPQIGQAVQVFVLGDREEFIKRLDSQVLEHRRRGDTRKITAINPTLELIGDEWADHAEGCLSVGPSRALVVRSTCVELGWLDRRGTAHREILVGWPARIAQHEFDHLQGTLFVDRMESATLASGSDFEDRWGASDETDIRAHLGLGPARYIDPPRRADGD